MGDYATTLSVIAHCRAMSTTAAKSTRPTTWQPPWRHHSAHTTSGAGNTLVNADSVYWRQERWKIGKLYEERRHLVQVDSMAPAEVGSSALGTAATMDALTVASGRRCKRNWTCCSDERAPPAPTPNGSPSRTGRRPIGGCRASENT